MAPPLEIGPAAQIIGEFAGRNPEEWDITECSFISNYTIKKFTRPGYEPPPVKFLTFSKKDYSAALANVSDRGGRRKVHYTYPYVDGQTTDDQGRKAFFFSLNCLFYGNGYKSGLDAFLAEANQPTPGILQHPVRGRIVVGIEDWELLHGSDSRKAVIARITFSEHTFTLDKIPPTTSRGPSTLKTALAAAVAALKTVNKVLTKVQSTIFATNEIRRRISSGLDSYKQQYLVVLQQINKTFGNGESTDLPMLVPVNDGGIAGPNGEIQGDVYTTVLSPNDPFRGLPQGTAQPNTLNTQQAVDAVTALRVQVSANIELMKSSLPNDQGALEFYDEILTLEETAIAMQDALEAAIQSSNLQIAQYVTPRLMSVREVAFVIGIGVNRCFEIELLNPSLLSVNYIPQGTSLQVPLA